MFQWNFSRQLFYIPTTANRVSQVFVWDVLAQFHGSQWCYPDLQREFGTHFPQLCVEFKQQPCFGFMYISERALVVSYASVSQDLFLPIISGYPCLSFTVKSATKPIYVSSLYGTINNRKCTTSAQAKVGPSELQKAAATTDPLFAGGS